jgi:hypothetical protein
MPVLCPFEGQDGHSLIGLLGKKENKAHQRSNKKTQVVDERKTHWQHTFSVQKKETKQYPTYNPNMKFLKKRKVESQNIKNAINSLFGGL